MKSNNPNLDLKLSGSKLTLSHPRQLALLAHTRSAKAGGGRTPAAALRMQVPGIGQNPQLGISQSFNRIPHPESDKDGFQDPGGIVGEPDSTFFRRGSAKNSVGGFRKVRGDKTNSQELS